MLALFPNIGLLFFCYQHFLLLLLKKYYCTQVCRSPFALKQKIFSCCYMY